MEMLDAPWRLVKDAGAADWCPARFPPDDQVKTSKDSKRPFSTSWLAPRRSQPSMAVA